ncbi:UNVERIFIED_ORG: hypothetical protein ABIC97_003170 [Peribacillus simplex]
MYFDEGLTEKFDFSTDIFQPLQVVYVKTILKTVAYPEIYNSHNKTTMWTPTKANIKVVPKDKRTKRDTNLKRKFRTWYIKEYGDPGWGATWPGLQAHHELPLEYGGTNSMSNVFPLTEDLHWNTVSPWWKAY